MRQEWQAPPVGPCGARAHGDSVVGHVLFCEGETTCVWNNTLLSVSAVSSTARLSEAVRINHWKQILPAEPKAQGRGSIAAEPTLVGEGVVPGANARRTLKCSIARSSRVLGRIGKIVDPVANILSLRIVIAPTALVAGTRKTRRIDAPLVVSAICVFPAYALGISAQEVLFLRTVLARGPIG